MASRSPRIRPHAVAEGRLVRNSAGERLLRIANGSAALLPRRPPRIASMSAEPHQADASDAAACKRRVKRKQTALPGLITFRNLRLELPCTISNLSGSGAHLRLPPSAFDTVRNVNDLPNEMMLVLRSDRLEVPCEVRWRRDSSLGVRFLGPPMPLKSRG